MYLHSAHLKCKLYEHCSVTKQPAPQLPITTTGDPVTVLYIPRNKLGAFFVYIYFFIKRPPSTFDCSLTGDRRLSPSDDRVSRDYELAVVISSGRAGWLQPVQLGHQRGSSARIIANTHATCNHS